MTFQGLEFTGTRPFKDVLIHGLIRDKQGRKFSKSLGNGIDPMDMVELYGADSLRFYLSTAASNGTDIRFDEDKIKATWNFINKLWNASRFVLMNLEDFKESDYSLTNLEVQDKWILTKLNKTIKEVTKFMDRYEFNNVGNILYDFIWSDFCDKYIEISKFSLDKNSTKSTLLKVLTDILKMLHPFMPFVTDEIYNMLPIKDENIMISTYPVYDKKYIDKESEHSIDDLLEFVRIFRNTRAENNITNDYKVKLEFTSDLIVKLLKLNDHIVEKDLDITSYKVKYEEYEATIYFEKTITEEDIKEKEKEIASLEASILRRKNLLANENYVKKAPANLVEEERRKLKSEEEKLAILKS
jgi:valyl-tRNA synthetase